MLNTKFRQLPPKQKGEIAEANIIAIFTELGYSISKPFGDNQAYDLLLNQEDKILRVQCKLGLITGTGIIFNTTKCRINSKKFVVTNYEGKIDSFAVWYPEARDKLFLIPISRVGKHATLLSLKDNSLAKLKANEFLVQPV